MARMLIVFFLLLFDVCGCGCGCIKTLSYIKAKKPARNKKRNVDQNK